MKEKEQENDDMDWQMKDAKNDAEDFEGINKEEYDRLFSELSEEDKKEFLGKKLYWIEGIWINPDGSIEE